MDDVKLQDAPERDRPEIERYIESHGGAIVLRVGDKIGSDAHAAFVEYKKANDYAEPPHDFVWIGEGTLGSPAGLAEIEAAITELRNAREAREDAERRLVEARSDLHPRFWLWWGGVMAGAGAAFALKHAWWPSWAMLIFFGLVFTWQARRGY